jgi:hypothetical protein
MASGGYYREEARRCRVRAAREPESASKQRWLQLAGEYELLADDLDEAQPSRPLIDQLVQSQANQRYQSKQRRHPHHHEPEPDTA